VEDTNYSHEIKLLHNGVVAVVVVVADAVATVVIYVVIISIPNEVAIFGSAETREKAIAGIADVANLAFSWPHLNFARMVFLAPLFTSAWLWVYLIVAHGMRAPTYVPGSLKALSKVLDFEGHPVRTIGYVAASVSTALIAIMMFV
jgi:hypothetical protein